MTPQPMPLGVHSEAGKLRKVMVCSPGLAHQRLTPANCDELLFDDVLWVSQAKRDHFDFVSKMRERGVEVISDMAGNRGILDLANVSGARWFISAIPDAFEAGTLIEQARSANPKLEIIARAHSDAEVDHLAQLGADRILMGEEEIARGMSGHVLDDLDAPAATVVAKAAADPLEPQPNVEIGGADPAPEADVAQDLPAGTPEGGDKPA